MNISPTDPQDQSTTVTPSSDAGKLRRILRFTTLLGVACSATFLVGVLAAQSANAAPADGGSVTKSAVSSPVATPPGLLGKVDHLVHDTVSVTGQTIGKVLNLAGSTSQSALASAAGQPGPAAGSAQIVTTTSSSTPVSVVGVVVKSPAVKKVIAVVSQPSSIIAPVAPITNAVDQLIEPPIKPILKPLEPVTSAVKSAVQKTATSAVSAVHQLTSGVLTPLAKLPIVGDALPPVGGLVNGVVDDLLPTVSGTLPVTGVLLPDSAKPVVVPPQQPGVPSLPGLSPMPGSGSSAMPSEWANPAMKDPAAEAATTAIASTGSAAWPAIESFTSLLATSASDAAATGANDGGSNGAVGTDPGQRTPSSPLDGALSGSNLSSFGGAPGGLAAIISNGWYAIHNVLSGSGGSPSSLAPETLAYDPGSSPD